MALSLNIRDVRCLRIFGGAGVDTVALTDSAVGAQQQDGPSHASASDQSPGPRQHRCQPRRGAPKLNGDEEKVSGEQGEKEMLWESQSGDGLSTLGTGGHRLDEGKAVMRNGSRSRKRNRNRIRWPGIAETSLSSLWSDAGRAAAAAAFRPDHIWNAQRHEQCKHLHRARLYDLSKSTIEQAAAAHAERDRVLNRLPKALPNAVPNAARQSASSINEGISEPIVPIVLIRKSAGEGEGDGPRRRRWGGRSDPYSGIDSLEGFDIILPAKYALVLCAPSGHLKSSSTHFSSISFFLLPSSAGGLQCGKRCILLARGPWARRSLTGCNLTPARLRFPAIIRTQKQARSTGLRG